MGLGYHTVMLQKLKMKYAIKSNDIEIGKSDLEFADESMSIKHGSFHPCPAYENVKAMFLEYAKAVSRLTDNPGTRNPELEQAQNRIHELILSLVDENDDIIPVENIEIFDPSEELNISEIEVTVVCKSYEVYEKYFK